MNMCIYIYTYIYIYIDIYYALIDNFNGRLALDFENHVVTWYAHILNNIMFLIIMFSYWPFLSQYLADLVWRSNLKGPASRRSIWKLRSQIRRPPNLVVPLVLDIWAATKKILLSPVEAKWELDDPWLNSLPWHQWLFCNVVWKVAWKSCCTESFLPLGLFLGRFLWVRLGYINTTNTQTCDNSSLDHPITANNHLNPPHDFLADAETIDILWAFPYHARLPGCMGQWEC